MLTLSFTLLILIFIIIMGQLNPGAITINLMGLTIRNIPLSLLMLLFLLIGVFLSAGFWGIRYRRLLWKLEVRKIEETTDRKPD